MAKFIFGGPKLNRKMVVELLPYIAELFATGIITKEERNEFVKLLQQIPNAEAEQEFKRGINELARIAPCRLLRTIQRMMNGEEANDVHQ